MRIPDFGRSIGIRSRGLLDPNQARYQTSPYPVRPNHYNDLLILCQAEPRHPRIFTHVLHRLERGDGLGYTIQYTPEGHTRTEIRRKSPPLRSIAALFLLILAITVRILFPAATEGISQHLLPVAPSRTETAFSSMVERLCLGEPIVDAVTAFCTEILNETS